MTIKTNPELPTTAQHTYTMTELKANSDILQRKLDTALNESDAMARQTEDRYQAEIRQLKVTILHLREALDEKRIDEAKKSGAAPAEPKKSNPIGSLLASIGSFILRTCSNIWLNVKRVLAIAIAFIVVYELIVLTPILNEPNALKKELDNQSQSARMLIQFGSGIANSASRALKADAGTALPEKKPQEKAQK